MTVKEFYDQIKGSYDEFLGRVGTEERAKKYIRMFTMDGFALTGGMRKASVDKMLEDYSPAIRMELVEPDGTVHYLDKQGNEIMVLTAEEAAKYEQEQREAQGFQHPTFCTLRLITMHGAAQDLQVQSLRSSSTWALRAKTLRTLQSFRMSLQLRLKR